ncbi:YIP1 family protein [uncultured Desulfovibrio sp.]|uniref:YIP1 family protein n=1 Tax=uncultured Desulfovibrio sp. TaxID=167968 RepID=UPI0003A4CCA0|nr:YIP1 family protein [uncultured Desulfovibrio sp.]
MNIICPQCGLSRELPADRLPPARAVIATCPKCACRFRFSAEAGVLETLDVPAARAAAPGEDDPLPPGAIVPGRGPAHTAAEIADTMEGGGRRNGSAPDHPEQPEPEEEDIRRTASRAYAREAARLDPETERGAGNAVEANPWETAPGRDGWPAAFYQTAMQVMFAAPRFFGALNPEAPQLRALSFYLVVCIFQTVVERFWGGMLLSIMAPSAATDPQLGKMLALLAPQTNLAMTLLLRTALLVLQLYVFSALVHLAYRFVAPDRTSFPLVFQIMSYSSAPALLCVIPGLGSLAGMIWGLACMAVGCRAALRLNWPQTLLGFVPVCLVMAPMLLQLLSAVKS